MEVMAGNWETFALVSWRQLRARIWRVQASFDGFYFRQPLFCWLHSFNRVPKKATGVIT